MKGRIPLKRNLRGLDFNPVRTVLLLAMLVALLMGCGLPGDPILDDFYTQNVYPGTASDYSVGSEDLPYSEGWFDELYVPGDVAIGGILAVEGALFTGGNVYPGRELVLTNEPPVTLEGDGRIWIEFRPDTDFETVRANGKPTWIIRGVFGGFSLPIYAADNEELYADICVPNRWDEGSDIYVHFDVWLDTAQDAADDSFRLQLAWENRDPGAGVVPNTSTTVEVETTTGICPQYSCFQPEFLIDYDGGARTIEGDDNLTLRLRRIAVVDGIEIAGEVVIDHVGVIFRCDKLGNPIP